MEKRIALIGIIVEDKNSVGRVNDTLHEFSSIIIGRMGIPYRENNMSIISVAIDGPQDKINTLSGKLGSIEGVSAKTLYTKS